MGDPGSCLLQWRQGILSFSRVLWPIVRSQRRMLRVGSGSREGTDVDLRAPPRRIIDLRDFRRMLRWIPAELGSSEGFRDSAYVYLLRRGKSQLLRQAKHKQARTTSSSRDLGNWRVQAICGLSQCQK